MIIKIMRQMALLVMYFKICIIIMLCFSVKDYKNIILLYPHCLFCNQGFIVAFIPFLS